MTGSTESYDEKIKAGEDAQEAGSEKSLAEQSSNEELHRDASERERDAHRRQDQDDQD